MSSEPKGVCPEFTARRIRVSIQNATPATLTRPTGPSQGLNIATCSPLAQSLARSPEMEPPRLPRSPRLGLSDPTPDPTSGPANPQMSPNNPFLSLLRASNPTAEPVPELRDPPPHFSPPPNTTPNPEPSDPQRELVKEPSDPQRD
ncbi:hypothetical protein FKP32DRAFT_1675524 [Trametes sanguinea]|nr:hypothetical protein FKP32DRAFT_1675524 [Trametes sanguinea]